MNGSATVSKFPSHPIFVFICRGTNQPSIAFESQSLPVLQPSPISVSVMVPQLLSMSMIFSFRTNGDDLSDKVAKSDSFTFPWGLCGWNRHSCYVQYQFLFVLFLLGVIIFGGINAWIWCNYKKNIVRCYSILNKNSSQVMIISFWNRMKWWARAKWCSMLIVYQNSKFNVGCWERMKTVLIQELQPSFRIGSASLNLLCNHNFCITLALQHKILLEGV